MSRRTPADPIAEFQRVYARACANAPYDPTTATLASVGEDSAPDARVVLVKQIDQRGFVFFTNYESRKARELTANPRAALCFYWPWLGIQVRVTGGVERTSAEESDAYFRTRPRGNQLGAWVSRQSAPLSSRAALVWDFLALEARYIGREIPRPPFWGGYRLVPAEIEFWRSRESRLHDRFRYRHANSEWKAERLYP